MDITREIAAKVLKVVDAGLTNGLGFPKPGEMCVEAAVCYALGEPHGDEPSCVSRVLRSLKIRLNDAGWSSNLARAKGLRRLALAQLGSKDALDEKEFARRVVRHALQVSVPAALRFAASVCKDKDHTAKLIIAAAKCEIEGTSENAPRADKIAAAARAADDVVAAAAAYAAANAAANAAAAARAAANAAANAARAATYAAANAATYAARAAANAAANAADAAAYAAETAAYAADDVVGARDRSLAKYAEAVVQILIEMKAPGCQWLHLAPLEQAS